MKQLLQIFFRQFFCILKHNINISKQPHNDLKILRKHLIGYLNIMKVQLSTVDEPRIDLNLKGFLLESKHITY